VAYDDQRTWRHLYDRRWERERLRFLDKNPLCVRCLELGRVVGATVVDHIKAHKGDVRLFRDQSNWQALCKRCHDSWKQRVENGLVEVDVEGYPKDGSW
jgi:5-methylcytosine-specific restriction protein A